MTFEHHEQMLLLGLLCNLGDKVTTYHALRYADLAEMNPLMNNTMQAIGISPTIILGYFLGATAMYCVYRGTRKGNAKKLGYAMMSGLTISYLYVVISNTINLLGIHTFFFGGA